MSLFRGVYPVAFPTIQRSHAEANAKAVAVLRGKGAVRDGDLVIITKGDLMGEMGGTNAMKIVRVGELVEPEP